jgi:cleavage and polyadenylation specificity factor subunit 1
MGLLSALPEANNIATPRTTLLVRFAHQFTRIYDVHRPTPEELARPVLPDSRRAPYILVPFSTTTAASAALPSTTLAGVFLTGDRPSWILRSDHGGIVIHAAAHSNVQSFTPCSLWGSRSAFLLYADDVRDIL